MSLICNKPFCLKDYAVGIGIFLCPNLFAQQNDTIYQYLDGSYTVTSVKKMVYKSKVYPQGELYTMEVMMPGGEPVYTAQYTDSKLSLLHGQYVRYYAKGKKQSAATFINGKTEGDWMWWYPNGNLMDSGRARNGIKDGPWYSWYPNGQLKLITHYATSLQIDPAIQTAKHASETAIYHGPYKAWYENGKLESEGMYSNHLKTGTWRWYHENGNRATVEEYNQMGKVTSMQCFDTTGAAQGDYCNLNKPAFLKDLGDFQTFLSQNFKWPAKVYSQNKKGSVWVSFLITREGKLSDVVVKGTTLLLEEAVKAFLFQLPDWEPAVSHNRMVPYEEKVEIIYEGKGKTPLEKREIPEMWRPDYIKEAMWE